MLHVDCGSYRTWVRKVQTSTSFILTDVTDLVYLYECISFHNTTEIVFKRKYFNGKFSLFTFTIVFALWNGKCIWQKMCLEISSYDKSKLSYSIRLTKLKLRMNRWYSIYSFVVFLYMHFSWFLSMISFLSSALQVDYESAQKPVSHLDRKKKPVLWQLISRTIRLRLHSNINFSTVRDRTKKRVWPRLKYTN